jgi:hypothetical protein
LQAWPDDEEAVVEPLKELKNKPIAGDETKGF